MDGCSDCRLWEMAARMVADDTVAFFHYDEKTQQITLCLNMNDVFCRAADAEPVPWDLIPEVYALWQERRQGWEGLVDWVAKRRGVEPLPERNK